MKKSLFLLPILAIFLVQTVSAGFGPTGLQQILGYGSTATQNNFGANYPAGFVFNSTAANYTLQIVQIYVSTCGGDCGRNTVLEVYKGNASCTGITGPQIGVNSSTVDLTGGSGVGFHNWTFTGNTTDLTKSQCYWIVPFTSSTGGNYFRIGETIASTAIWGYPTSHNVQDILLSGTLISTLNVSLFGANPTDASYPKFSNYSDNSNIPVYNGTTLNPYANFNVSVQSSNGTVYLEINQVNYTATNYSTNANMFNVTLSNLINITYTYKWIAYGDGSSHNVNTTAGFPFIVNSKPNLGFFYFDLSSQTNVLLLIFIIVLTLCLMVFINWEIGCIFLLIEGFVLLRSATNIIPGLVVVIGAIVLIFMKKEGNKN